MRPTIALLTDFGHVDSYVGVMKGVIASITPEANVIDITHAIGPQNVRQAAFTLLYAFSYFPAGTVFLVVVDPGVGTERRPLGVQCGDYAFIAPDNGVLSYALAALETPYQAVELADPQYRLPEVSNTFHGRDVFAPAAAYVASGVPPLWLGPELDSIQTFGLPRLDVTDRHLVGEVIHVDHFGNAITSIGPAIWEDNNQLVIHPPAARDNPLVFSARTSTLRINGETLDGIHQTYGAVAPGSPLAIIGSSGYVEIAINQGHAAYRLGVKAGDLIELQPERT
jgi:hypothetical protein